MRGFIVFASAIVVGLCANNAAAQKAPEHASPHKQLTLSCERCHVSTSFKEIRFAHDKTSFPLGNRHDNVKCLSCHNVEDFSKVDASCATCHDDVHADQMGADCVHCHVQEGWRVFDAEALHGDTGFPMMGRHLVLDCEVCHTSMVLTDFRRLSSDCFSCHANDYNAVATPNHASSGFSHECRQCHQVTGWTPAAMPDHDAIFPIFSGTHRGRWSECASCHIDANNSHNVSCLTCHEHDRSRMDPFHQGFPGYTYDTPACLQCHPTGEAGRFGEHETFFPIFSGKHSRGWTSCATCHPNAQSRTEYTCLTCHEHNQERMDDKHLGGVQGYSYDSPSCLFCHPGGRKE